MLLTKTRGFVIFRNLRGLETFFQGFNIVSKHLLLAIGFKTEAPNHISSKQHIFSRYDEAYFHILKFIFSIFQCYEIQVLIF